MIFAENEEKLGAYYMHTLLKAIKTSNLFRLTAYMPLIMKSGVALIRDFILVSFFGQFVEK